MRDSYMRMASRYKLSCLEDVNRSISREGTQVTDLTIAKVLTLIMDEVSSEKTTQTGSVTERYPRL
jgi:hypothetical protein